MRVRNAGIKEPQKTTRNNNNHKREKTARMRTSQKDHKDKGRSNDTYQVNMIGRNRHDRTKKKRTTMKQRMKAPASPNKFHAHQEPLRVTRSSAPAT